MTSYEDEHIHFEEPIVELKEEKVDTDNLADKFFPENHALSKKIIELRESVDNTTKSTLFESLFSSIVLFLILFVLASLEIILIRIIIKVLYIKMTDDGGCH